MRPAIYTLDVPVNELVLHSTYELFEATSHAQQPGLTKILSIAQSLGAVHLIVVAQQPKEPKPRRVIFGGEHLRALRARSQKHVRVVVVRFDSYLSEDESMVMLNRGSATTPWQKCVLVSVLWPLAREVAKQAQRRAGGNHAAKPKCTESGPSPKRNPDSRQVVATLLSCRKDLVKLLDELFDEACRECPAAPEDSEIAIALRAPAAKIEDVHARFVVAPNSDTSSEASAGTFPKKTKASGHAVAKQHASSGATTPNERSKAPEPPDVVEQVGALLSELARKLTHLDTLRRSAQLDRAAEKKLANHRDVAAKVRRRLDRVLPPQA